jgi:hypothetical protein
VAFSDDAIQVLRSGLDPTARILLRDEERLFVDTQGGCYIDRECQLCIRVVKPAFHGMVLNAGQAHFFGDATLGHAE